MNTIFNKAEIILVMLDIFRFFQTPYNGIDVKTLFMLTFFFI